MHQHALSSRPLFAVSVSVFVLGASAAVYACSDSNGTTASPQADGGGFDAAPPNDAGEAGDAATCAGGQFTWATSGGGAGQGDDVNGVAVDGSGNTWIVGTFIGDAKWGDATLTAQDKVHTSGFFAKLDPTGKVVFAHPIEPSIAGEHRVDAARVRLDAAGNAYVVGTFDDQIDVDDVHLLGQANGSMYVLQIDPTGKAKWGVASKNDGGSREEGYDVAVDSAGDVYVAGSYNGRVQLGSLEVPASATTSDQAVFVAKYAPLTSQWAWLEGWSGRTPNSGGEAHAIALGGDGSVYAGGTIENDVDFGGGRYFADATGSFLVKLDRGDGHLLWATDLAPPSDQTKVVVRAAVSDTAGNLFVTGSYTGSVVFAAAADVAMLDGGPAADAGSHGQSLAVTGTGEDMFVVKYDATGTPAWAKHAGNGNGNTHGDDIAFDGASGLYVGGFHQGPTTFDAETLSHSGDLFVARYDVAGAVAWVQGNDNASHGGGDALGVAVPSPTSGVYIGGSYDTETTLGAFHLTGAGQDDALVGRMCN